MNKRPTRPITVSLGVAGQRLNIITNKYTVLYSNDAFKITTCQLAIGILRKHILIFTTAFIRYFLMCRFVVS